MKARFESSTGMTHEGEVTGGRGEELACKGLLGLVWGLLAYEATLPPYIRIKNDEGTEMEVHPSRIKYEADTR